MSDISLRDLFAANVMSGIMSNPFVTEASKDIEPGKRLRDTANVAYTMADALLHEREKRYGQDRVASDKAVELTARIDDIRHGLRSLTDAHLDLRVKFDALVGKVASITKPIKTIRRGRR